MEIGVNIANVEEFATEKLPGLLTSNCEDFATCAFILDVVLKKIDEIKSEDSSLQN